MKIKKNILVLSGVGAFLLISRFAVAAESSSDRQSARADLTQLREIIDQRVQKSVEEKRSSALKELEQEVEAYRVSEKRRVTEELVPYKEGVAKEVQKDLDRYAASERSKIDSEVKAIKDRHRTELDAEKQVVIAAAKKEAQDKKARDLKEWEGELGKMRQEKLAALDLEIANLKRDRLKTVEQEAQKARSEKLTQVDREVEGRRRSEAASLDQEMRQAREKRLEALDRDINQARSERMQKIEKEVDGLKAGRNDSLRGEIEKNREARMAAVDKEIQKARNEGLAEVERQLAQAKKDRLKELDREIEKIKRESTPKKQDKTEIKASVPTEAPAQVKPDSKAAPSLQPTASIPAIAVPPAVAVAPAAEAVPAAGDAAKPVKSPKTAEAAEKANFKSGDEIRISVYREPDLTGDFVVDANGSISYPLVGKIDVMGFDSQKLSAHIGEALKKYIVDPQVSVNLKKGPGGNAAQTVTAVTLLGEVRKPGAYDPGQGLTLTKLIALGGGPNDVADGARIKIIKKRGDSVEVTVVDLGQIAEGLMPDPGIEEGDRVVVPAKEGDVEGVVVLGEVKRPGIFEKTKGLTLLRIVAKAGGLTQIADPRHIRIIRQANGKEHTGVFDMNQILAGKLEDPVVENADKIFVPESIF